MGRLLEIENLSVTYRRARVSHKALRGVSVVLSEGETMCLVGGSGAGKTTLALAVARILPRTAVIQGSVSFQGCSIYDVTGRDVEPIRRYEISFVFQDAVGSLVPSLKIGKQMRRVVRHRSHRKMSSVEVRRRCEDLLRMVGFIEIDRLLQSFPRELSGGMCQRVMIAFALSATPKLLIADEPVSSLDAVSQLLILKTLFSLQDQKGFAMLYVTHDLRLAHHFDRIGVLAQGKLVEEGPTSSILSSPKSTATHALLEAAKELSLPGGLL